MPDLQRCLEGVKHSHTILNTQHQEGKSPTCCLLLFHIWSMWINYDLGKEFTVALCQAMEDLF